MIISAEPPGQAPPQPSRPRAGRPLAARTLTPRLGRAAGLALVPGLALTLALAACGSSSGSAAAAATASATRQACQQIAADLTDGPDPGADPAGYAEAQILPLRQVHVTGSSLKTAVSALATAYQRVFSSDGQSSAANQAVAAASKKLNAICPGAAS
jgi:hypothetical protein